MLKKRIQFNLVRSLAMAYMKEYTSCYRNNDAALFYTTATFSAQCKAKKQSQIIIREA